MHCEVALKKWRARRKMNEEGEQVTDKSKMQREKREGESARVRE